MITKYPWPVEEAMRYTFSTLNEHQRRLFAASEALKLGHGGIVGVSGTGPIGVSGTDWGKRDRSGSDIDWRKLLAKAGQVRNWAAPPTSERSSPGRGILISAHPSRATRGTIGRL